VTPTIVTIYILDTMDIDYTIYMLAIIDTSGYEDIDG
jgi:GTPase SAR1 family protein